MNLIDKLRRERILATVLSKFNKNRREKKKKGERESRGISASLLPKFLCPKMLSVQLKKSNCGNVIAEKGKKKIVLAIVAMRLQKMEKKNYEICE